MCCKRRVLEFDEFLKIEGCKTGRHLFVPKNTETKVCITSSYRRLYPTSLSRLSNSRNAALITIRPLLTFTSPSSLNKWTKNVVQ